MIHQRNDAIQLFNHFGEEGRPFFFFTDFLGQKTFIEPLDAQSGTAAFDFSNSSTPFSKPFSFEKDPISMEAFEPIVNQVIREIEFGNSYLVNLTFKTPIRTSLSLEDIYLHSQAKYKVLFRDHFVVFSPETFIKIKDGLISSYPMKGTINADVHEAAEKILADPKEFAEHVTIVDLIRNDLSMVAKNVTVSKFRYLSEIDAHDKKLLQVSSEIKGQLPVEFQKKLGDLFFKLLPAGSISGAPKTKTVEIIEAAESYKRGFYTGVCGVFDGANLDSGVMIRFIEKEGNQYFYKSGGGITSFSSAASEYQEMIDKIYVPIH